MKEVTFTAVIFWVYIVMLSILLLIPVPQGDGPPGPDKIIHFSAFLILGSLQFFEFGKKLKPFLLVVLYAALIEATQGLTGYRSFEWLDMAANFTGCLASRLLLFIKKNH